MSENIEKYFGVKNGLSGMQRDVILRLCYLMWHNPGEIRAIFGMNQKHFIWKRHSFFLKGRPWKVPVSFRSNSQEFYTLTYTPAGHVCTFGTFRERTLFLNVLIRDGIFRWTVKIKYEIKKGKYGQLYLGGASPSDLSYHDKNVLSSNKSCALVMFRNKNVGRLYANLVGVRTRTIFDEVVCDGIHVPDESFVSVEIHTQTRRMSFFVDEKKVPYGISHIPIPLYLGVSACLHPCAFTSVSFFRLPSPSSFTAACTFYPCKKEKN